MTKISDLPMDMVEEVLSRLAVTSLRVVRFTCKTWNTLSKHQSFTKKHVAQAKKKQGKGFEAIMATNNSVYLMSVNLHGIRIHENTESCIKQKGKLVRLDNAGRIKISQVYHCDGLLLCITTNGKNCRLVVLNPYSGKTRWIKPLKSYNNWDMYALGYEEKKNGNRSYKILRYITRSCVEMYSFDSNSWKVIEVKPDWIISHSQRGVSVKGNTYWYVHSIQENPSFRTKDEEKHIFVGCFDFTNERFEPRLSLPFYPQMNATVVLSTVREEQLAVLHQLWTDSTTLRRRIWISNKVEPNALSWSNLFLQVGRTRELDSRFGPFFVDEEEKLAVIFDKGKHIYTPTRRNTAYIVGDDHGYMKKVDLGESTQKYSFPLVCSYVPSCVQI